MLYKIRAEFNTFGGSVIKHIAINAEDVEEAIALAVSKFDCDRTDIKSAEEKPNGFSVNYHFN
jgi:hypothetical protein